VQVLGRAVYHHPGVTSQLSMDEFWTQYANVDMSRYPLLKANLIKYTQLNGSFYGNMPWMNAFKKVTTK
jgi:capsular polysaccharide export protein